MAPYYADDMVTIYLGDCREITNWLTADVLVTDPPYGIGYSAVGGSKWHRPIANDQDFTAGRAAIDLWGSRPMAVFASNGSLVDVLASVDAHQSRRRIATWHKTNLNGVAGDQWLNDVEFVVIGVSAYPKLKRPGVITARANVGNPNWSTRQNAYLHPTQKSVAGMEQLIDACPPGVITDPFAGSGSTLVAARNLGRKAIGVELDERYCETIAKRLAADCLPLVAG